VFILNTFALDLSAKKIEYFYDVKDTNAINFLTGDGYFSIQRCVYIDPEDDPRLNDPYWEFNSQEMADSRHFAEIIFHAKSVTLVPKGKFIGRYDLISIKLPTDVDIKLIDFFVNYLFSGDFVKYDDEVTSELRIKQSNFPDEL